MAMQHKSERTDEMSDRKVYMNQPMANVMDALPSTPTATGDKVISLSEVSAIANQTFEKTRSGNAKTFLDRSRQTRSGE